MRTPGALLSVMLLTLAGCLAPLPEDATAQELEAAAAALRPVGAWYSMAVAAGPDAPLAAAWFVVPEGGVQDWAHNDEGERDVRVVAIEAAYVFDEPVTPEAVATLAFRHEDGELAASLLSFDVPSTMSYAGGAFAMAATEDHEPTLAPRFLHLAWDEDVEAGERIGIVAGVRSPESAAGQLLFRVRLGDEGDFGEDEEPAEDVLAFAKEGAAATPLAIVGQGAGVFAAMRTEFTGGAFLPFDVTYTAGEVEVEGGQTPEGSPVATGRSSQWRTRDEAAAGWTHAYAFYHSSSGMGEWSGLLETRNERAEAAEGVVTVAPGLFSTFGALFAVGDGGGPAASELGVSVVGPATGDSLALLQVGLGTPLADLFGEPVRTSSDVYADGSPLRRDATGWTLDAGGARIPLPLRA